MKLKKGDKVMVIAGRDRGKRGEIMAVLPKRQAVVVGGVNTVKRHTKPDAKNPKGGIVPIDKPIAAARVMVLDPQTGKPARVGYTITDQGEKVRVFRVSKFTASKIAKPAAPEVKS